MPHILVVEHPFRLPSLYLRRVCNTFCYIRHHPSLVRHRPLQQLDGIYGPEPCMSVSLKYGVFELCSPGVAEEERGNDRSRSLHWLSHVNDWSM